MNFLRNLKVLFGMKPSKQVFYLNTAGATPAQVEYWLKGFRAGQDLRKHGKMSYDLGNNPDDLFLPTRAQNGV